ncbi:MAG: YARHG domain-containing protein, partial [Acidobacteria bacterium]|nr:YARHG domain-containing protein [Acidobacteriota bacterium]
FELQIHPDRGIFFIPLSFREDGKEANWEIIGKGTFSKPIPAMFEGEKPVHKLVQLQSGYLSLKEKNFQPFNDISMGEYNWNVGWYPRMCVDKDRCTSAEDSADNFYQYFRVEPGDYTTAEDLKTFSDDELKIIRNFAYAIRGYAFKSPLLTAFYSQFFWYKPDPQLKMEDIKLSAKETEFLKKVAAAEK